MFFSDGDSVSLCNDIVDMRSQLDRLEDGGFDKYQAYMDTAQLNLEVRRFTRDA